MRIVLAVLLGLSCTTIVAAVSWQPPQPEQWYGLEPITVCYATDAVHAEMTHIDTGAILFAPIATELLIAQTDDGFQITNIVAFEHRAAPVLLPVVLSSTQAQPQPIVVSPPQGIKLHLTNSQLIRDSAGVLFAATRASSDIGGVVWMVKDGVTTVVLQLGPEAAFANGELIVWPDQKLYYITVDKAQTAITAWPIKEWTP